MGILQSQWIADMKTENEQLRAELATANARIAALEVEGIEARYDAEDRRLELESLKGALAKDGAVAAWAMDMDAWIGMHIEFGMPDSLHYDDEFGFWRATTDLAEGGGRGLIQALIDVRKWHDSAPPSDAARAGKAGG